MRGLGSLLLILGVVWLGSTWLPDAWQEHLPPALREASIGGGAGVALLGLLLRFLGRHRIKPAASDAALRQALAARGLEFSGPTTAWQAQGDMHGQMVIVRRDEAQAGRYGRAWVLIVEVAGQAQSPWPLGHDAARLLEPGPPRYVALIPDALRLDGTALLGRLRAIVGARAG